MISVFNKDVGGGGFIANVGLHDPKLLSGALTATLRRSMHSTATRSLQKSRSRTSKAAALLGAVAEEERTFTLTSSKPEWDQLPAFVGEIYSNDTKVDVYQLNSEAGTPKPLAARVVSSALGLMNVFSAPFTMIGSLMKSITGIGADDKKTLIKVAPEPFAKGNVRFARHGLIRVGEAWRDCVLKDFLRKGGNAHSKEKYLESIEESTVARALADEFNKQMKPPRESKIGFILSPVVAIKYGVDKSSVEEDRFYYVEQVLQGEFVKYSSNTGYWDEEKLDPWLLKFALWTAEVTKGFMMVTDLQGCRTAEGYQFTDPVILCKDVGRFSSTNLGEGGIERCKKSAQALLNERYGAWALP